MTISGTASDSHHIPCVITEREPIAYEAYQHQKYRKTEIIGALTTDQNQHVRGDTPLIVEVENGENRADTS